MSEVNCSKISNISAYICLICSPSSFKRLKDTNTNAISTQWIIAKVSQKLYYDFMSLVFLTCSACLFDFVGRREVHLKVYWRVVAKHSASRSLIPQDVLSLNGFFLTVFIVAVLFLRIPFTIIWACMEAGRRNQYWTRPNAMQTDFSGFSLTRLASFDFATSCSKIKVWCMHSNGRTLFL